MMRQRLVTMVFASCLCTSGCTLVSDVTHLVGYKAAETMRDCAEQRRNRRWAEGAWEMAQADARTRCTSADYADGFKCGFADFLYRGGNGEPPFVAPKRYRALRYQTEGGYQAVLEWFAGYRHGASVADSSGYRRLVIGPTALQEMPAAPDMPAPPPGEQGQEPVPGIESLPTPRPLFLGAAQVTTEVPAPATQAPQPAQERHEPTPETEPLPIPRLLSLRPAPLTTGMSLAPPPAKERHEPVPEIELVPVSRVLSLRPVQATTEVSTPEMPAPPPAKERDELAPETESLPTPRVLSLRPVQVKTDE